MIRNVFSIGLVLALSALPAAAQTTHVCDLQPVTTGTFTEGAATLEFCLDPKDANGNPKVTLSEALYVDGVRFSITAAPSGTPSPASGKQLYATGVTLVKGQHAYVVAAVDDKGVEGEKSSPFTASVSPKIGPTVAPVWRGVRQP